MKTLRLALLLLCAFCLLQCKKDDTPPEPEPQLPPITQEGKNTFGALIDGKVFVAANEPSMFGGPCLRSKPSNRFEVAGWRYRGEVWSISMAIGTWDVLPGRYKIRPYYDFLFVNGPFEGAVGRHAKDNSFCADFTEADSSGYIEITRIDTVNRIIAGTFAFTAVDECDGKIIKVEQGRFDYRFGESY